MLNNPAIMPLPPIQLGWRAVCPRPLVALNAAMCDLDMSAEQVRALIDEGGLIGFNIAVKPAGRANLRLLTRSVKQYGTTFSKITVMDWPEIIQEVLPHDKSFIRGIEIQRNLNCDRGHVENLIEAGAFQVVKKARPGPDGSPIVIRGSFEAFLKGRML